MFRRMAYAASLKLLSVTLELLRHGVAAGFFTLAAEPRTGHDGPAAQAGTSGVGGRPGQGRVGGPCPRGQTTMSDRLVVAVAPTCQT